MMWDTSTICETHQCVTVGEEFVAHPHYITYQHCNPWSVIHRHTYPPDGLSHWPGVGHFQNILVYAYYPCFSWVNLLPRQVLKLEPQPLLWLLLPHSHWWSCSYCCQRWRRWFDTFSSLVLYLNIIGDDGYADAMKFMVGIVVDSIHDRYPRCAEWWSVEEIH